MTMTPKEEIRRMTGRRLPRAAVIAIALAAIGIVIAALLWPLVEGAHQWQHRPLVNAAPAIPACMPRTAPLPPEASPMEVDTGIPTKIAGMRIRVVRQTTVIRTTVTHTSGIIGELRGTGLIVQKDIVITASHIVARRLSGPSIRVYCNGKSVVGEVLADDPLRDVAVLRATGCDGETLTFETRHLKDADRLYVTGYLFDVISRKSGTIASRYDDRTHPVTRARLTPADFADKDAETPHEKADFAVIRWRITELQRLGLPEDRAVRGAPVPGQSGSPITLPDGSVIGMLIIAHGIADQGIYVPAVSELAVLREAGISP